MRGATKYAPQYVPIDTTEGMVLVEAVEGFRIRVHNIVLIASDDTTVSLHSVTVGEEEIQTPLTGEMTLTTASGFAPGEAEMGHFETNPGESLVLELGVEVQVGGWLVYALAQ